MSIKQGLKFKKVNFTSKIQSLFCDLALLSSCKYDANISSIVLKNNLKSSQWFGSFDILAKLPGIGLEEEKL